MKPGRNLLGRERDERDACPRSPSAARRPRSVGRRNIAGSWTPGFCGDRNGPFEVDAEDARVGGNEPAVRRRARRASWLGVSLISVGSSAVVPKLRCARTMAAMPSGVGSSLNSTSPPPFTWMSMKPGASQAPSGKASRRYCRRATQPGAEAPRCAIPRSPRRNHAAGREPSKTVPAATACWSEALIGCA